MNHVNCTCPICMPNKQYQARICEDPECHTDFLPVFKEMCKRGAHVRRLRKIAIIAGLALATIACFAQTTITNWSCDETVAHGCDLLSSVTESPVTWTTNDNIAMILTVPDAKDCTYWGAVETKGKCTADLIFKSEPKNLQCHIHHRYSNIVRCTWDKPK